MIYEKPKLRIFVIVADFFKCFFFGGGGGGGYISCAQSRPDLKSSASVYMILNISQKNITYVHRWHTFFQNRLVKWSNLAENKGNVKKKKKKKKKISKCASFFFFFAKLCFHIKLKIYRGNAMEWT